MLLLSLILLWSLLLLVCHLFLVILILCFWEMKPWRRKSLVEPFYTAMTGSLFYDVDDYFTLFHHWSHNKTKWPKSGSQNDTNSLNCPSQSPTTQSYIKTINLLWPKMIGQLIINRNLIYFDKWLIIYFCKQELHISLMYKNVLHKIRYLKTQLRNYYYYIISIYVSQFSDI